MTLIGGIVSYDRPASLERLLRSIRATNMFDTSIAICDASTPHQFNQYRLLATRYGDMCCFEIAVGKRGSAVARNTLFDYVARKYSDDDVLITLDDDYEVPHKMSLIPALSYFRDRAIGIVGGKVVPSLRRNVDPDFRVEFLPALADILSLLTGFVFLDCKHGPRVVRFTTPLMALRVRLLRDNLRYDSSYTGSAYREESDFQAQVTAAGYRIIFEPRFFVYDHTESAGGNRDNSVGQRFFYKARNNVLFQRKFHSLMKLLTSQFIIQTYSFRYGLSAFVCATKGFRDGLVR